MSAGVGVFPDDGDSYERLLVKADRRMYQEKARRKRHLTEGARRREPARASSAVSRVLVSRVIRGITTGRLSHR